MPQISTFQHSLINPPHNSVSRLSGYRAALYRMFLSQTALCYQQFFDIVRENCEKIISAGKKNISIDFRYEDCFRTADFYSLISVLNNFIINSIDAIKEAGQILVEETNSGNEYVFRVIDNGTGIDDDEIEMLFEPGYSTKYDPVTGRMSTGIGLSHVKQIVENYFEGDINVHSSGAEGITCFEVRIPKTNIELKG